MYTALVMLYASHVIDGKRTIDSVPVSLKNQVQEIVDSSVKKQDGETE